MWLYVGCTDFAYVCVQLSPRYADLRRLYGFCVLIGLCVRICLCVGCKNSARKAACLYIYGSSYLQILGYSLFRFRRFVCCADETVLGV